MVGSYSLVCIVNAKLCKLDLNIYLQFYFLLVNDQYFKGFFRLRVVSICLMLSNAICFYNIMVNYNKWSNFGLPMAYA